MTNNQTKKKQKCTSIVQGAYLMKKRHFEALALLARSLQVIWPTTPISGSKSKKFSICIQVKYNRS